MAVPPGIARFGFGAMMSGMGPGSTEQNLSVTDIISEGPIGGLVLGGKSIFLNDDPIFDDQEVGFASTAGMTIDGQSSSNTITINDYDSEEFDYSPENNPSAKRFILVHDLYKFTHSSTTPYTFNDTSAASGPQSPVGYFLKIDGDFSTLANRLIAGNSNDGTGAYQTISASNFVDGDGIVTVWNKTKDRFVEGMIYSITAPVSATNTPGQLCLILNKKRIENDQWVKTSELKVHVSELLQITSISGKTITAVSGPSINFSKKFFAISKPIYTSSTTNTPNTGHRKYRSSGYQFRPGTIDQDPLSSLSGGVGNTTLALPVSSTQELNVGVPASIISTLDSSAEVDSVRLLFKYPAGLHSLNTDTGDKNSAGAGYVIRLETLGNPSTGGDNTFIDQGFLPGTSVISSNLRDCLTGQGAGAKGAGIAATGLNSPSKGLLVQMTTDGGPVDVLAVDTPIFVHGGKYLSGASFTHTIDLTPYQPFLGFKLTICRITNNETNTDDTKGRAHAQGSLLFIDKDNKKHQGIQSGGVSNAIGIIQDRVHFPFTALAEVTFNTRQFTSMPTRAYEVYGLKVKVPSNYTTREEFGEITLSDADNSGLFVGKEQIGSLPEGSRLYNGFFTGSFREERVYTDNPAWVFYDMVTNNRYGAGEFVKDFDIDKFALYKIARYCDELVADGKGGVEPRFRANIYISKATDVYKVLKDMATIFRGMLYWMDSKLTLVNDEKRAPVYNFNKTNVIDGDFSYEYTGSKTRQNQIAVTWNNPLNEYKQEAVFVEDRENIVKTGKIVKGKAVAFGCTSEGQAIRYGRWKLFTAINQTEICSFGTAINAAFLAPGDVINIQDNHDAGFAFGGRISNITLQSTDSNNVETTQITLDRSLARNNADTADAQIGAAGEYKLALLLAEEAFIAQELVQITDTLEVTPGNAITEWRIYLPSTKTTSRVKIVQDQTERDNLSAPQSGDHVYQLADSKLYVYGSSSYSEVSDGTTIDTLVAAAVDKQNRPVHITHTTSTRVKEIDCLQGNDGSTNTLGKILTTTELNSRDRASALIGRIWAIKDDNSELLGSYKPYKILAINQRENQYEITAVEYFDVKFDAIENDFTTAVDDPIFPTETDKADIEAPRALRASKTINNSGGVNIILEWLPPENAQNVVGYTVTTEIPGFPNEQVSTTTSVEFPNVLAGRYVFQVKSLDGEGRHSAPAILEVEVGDDTLDQLTRLFGVLKGGSVNSTTIIQNNRTTTPVTQKIKFEKNPVTFLSPADDSETGVSLSGSSAILDYAILKDHDTESWFVGDYDTTDNVPRDTSNLTFNSAYVAFRGYSGTPRSLRLVNYVEDNTLGVSYWYDQTKQTQKIFNENTVDTSLHFTGSPDIWTQPNGRVTIDNNTSKVVGTNTTFLTDLKLSNVLKFSESFAAKITSIESDTVLFIDKVASYKEHAITGAAINGANIEYTSVNHTFVVGDDVSIRGLLPDAYNTSISNGQAKEKVVGITVDADGIPQTFLIKNNTSASGTLSDDQGLATTAIGTAAAKSDFFKDELDLDLSFDFILGRINHTGAFKNFLTLDPDISSPRGLFVDATIAVLNYPNGDTTTVQSTVLPSEGIFLTATPVGYTNPEFRVTGTGFSQTSVSADAADAFTAPSSGILVKQIHDNSNIVYGSGTSLSFTVRVREAGDPDNVDKIVDKTFTIIKVKDGASGSEGRTVALVAEDNTVLFDGQGRNPEYTGSSNNKLTLTATAFNFPANPLFRFSKDDQVGTFSTSNTLELDISSSDTLKSLTQTRSPGMASGDRIPKVVKVEVAVDTAAANAGEISATDSTPLILVRKNADAAPIIVLTNPTVAVSTDKNGTFTGSTLTGSGTSMEVLIGGTTGTYVGNTGTAFGKTDGQNGLASDGVLEQGQWYIQGVSTTDGNISAGTISDANSDNIIDIAPATVSGSFNLNETITWTIRLNSGDVTFDQLVRQTIFKSIAGQDGTTPNPGADGDDATTASANQSFNFIANALGVVANNTFSTTLNIRQGTQEFLFATSGTAANTYGVTFTNVSNCVPLITADSSNRGIISIANSSAILAAGSLSAVAKFTAVVTKRSDSTTLTTLDFILGKVEQSVREGGTFIKTGATHANAFKNTLDVQAAQEAAAFVIANSVDGFISQNDRVTLVGTDSQSNPISATRIYINSTRHANAASVGTGDFSSVVAEHIDGSVIVDGTLSANKLAANTVLSNNLIAQSTIQIANGGKIFGGNKESGFGDDDVGFHLDSAGNVNIGNATNYLKFHVSGDDTVDPPIAPGSFELAGNINLQGPRGLTGADGDSITGATVDTNTNSVNYGKLLLTVTNADGVSSQVVVPGSVIGPQGSSVEGPQGPTSSAFYTIIRAGNLDEPSNSEIHVATGRDDGSTEKGFPVKGDTAIVVNTTPNPDTSKGWKYNGSSWEDATLFITGSVIVNGSISSTELAANSVKAAQLEISNATANNSGIYFDSNSGFPRIDIYDGGNNLRVRLGYLG